MKLGQKKRSRAPSIQVAKPLLTVPRQPLTDWDRITERVALDRMHNEDVMVNASDVAFTDDCRMLVRGDTVLSVSSVAYSHVCTKLNLPARFMRKCPSTGPASQKAIFDYWLDRNADKQFLLRTKMRPDNLGSDGTLRAVFSDRYSVFDNHQLIDVLRPTVESEGLEVQRAFITDKSFHLRLVWPEQIEVGTLRDGEPDMHMFGYHQANSEVGFLNLFGNAFLFREICTNGMIAVKDKRNLMQVRHMNVSEEVVEEELDLALMEARDWQGECVDRLRVMRTIKVDDPEAMVREHLRDSSKKFVEAAVSRLKHESGTQFGVVQAITAAARKLPVEERVTAEASAGRILLAA